MKKEQHVHIYDKDGKQLCCTQEEKIYTQAGAKSLLKEEHHDHDHSHGESQGGWQQYLPAIISLSMILIGILIDNYFKLDFFKGYLRLVWYVAAYLPVGFPVIKEAFATITKGEFFTEFTLMVLATFGAFSISEYPEGVAVMLFYAIGELFQSAAVNQAKNNIKALLDVRPNTANILIGNSIEIIKPEDVNIGDTIQVLSGEKVPLDGEMLFESSSFNTAALTGESKPKTIKKGEIVLAGMLNLDKVITLKVTKKFADSSLARILDMVQNATARKAQTELLIRRFAKIYTPIVFFLALALVIVPYFILNDYVFTIVR